MLPILTFLCKSWASLFSTARGKRERERHGSAPDVYRVSRCARFPASTMPGQATRHSCALQPAFPFPAPFGSPGAGRRGGLDGVDAQAISRVLQGQQLLLIGLMVILHGETGTRRAASSGDRPQLERQTGGEKAEPLSQVLPRQQAGPKRAAASWMGGADLAGKRAVERARPRFRGVRGARCRGRVSNVDGASAEGFAPWAPCRDFPSLAGILRQREREIETSRCRAFLCFQCLLLFLLVGRFLWEEGVIFKPARTQDTLSFLFYELGSSNVLLLALLLVLSPQTDAARIYL